MIRIGWALTGLAVLYLVWHGIYYSGIGVFGFWLTAVTAPLLIIAIWLIVLVISLIMRARRTPREKRDYGRLDI